MNRDNVTAPDVLRDARQLFLAHKKKATKASKVKNLELLWEVLESIRGDGQRDYSLAEIGRRLTSLGGPKTQSLRNPQGSEYREIISAYADAVTGFKKYAGKNKTNVEEALSLIVDQSIAGVLRAALEDAKKLKIRNDNLHAAFKNLEIGASVTNINNQSTGKDVVQSTEPPARDLIPRYVNALRRGIDANRLNQQGLKIAEDGSIVDQHGDKIFPTAFAFAIQAILDSYQ